MLNPKARTHHPSEMRKEKGADRVGIEKSMKSVNTSGWESVGGGMAK